MSQGCILAEIFSKGPVPWLRDTEISMCQKHTELSQLCDQALEMYRMRVLDNIDLLKLNEVSKLGKARIIASALMERGDARAFFLARKILDAIDHGAH